MAFLPLTLPIGWARYDHRGMRTGDVAPYHQNMPDGALLLKSRSHECRRSSQMTMSQKLDRRRDIEQRAREIPQELLIKAQTLGASTWTLILRLVLPQLLPRLLTARRNGEALDLLRSRMKTDADFRPIASADLLQLAELARDAGDRPTARALLHDFERFYPRDPARTSAAMLIRQLER